MTEAQEQRLISAIEWIARTMAAEFQRRYPEKRQVGVRDADVTHVKTEEELIREEISGEDAEVQIDRWASLS